MAFSRSFLTIVAAAAIALVGLMMFSGSPAEPPAVHAGPCAALPELYYEDDPLGSFPLARVRVYGEAGKTFGETLYVETDPPTLPTGKPPVTIMAEEVSGHVGIGISFNPSQSDGSFYPRLVVGIDEIVPPGVYEYEISINCHGEIETVELLVYVNTCPAPESAAGPAGLGGTPTEIPFPDECVESTPTPTPTAPPSDTPTPTEPQGEGIIFADHNCNDEVDPVDSLFVLRDDAGLATNTGDCPPMGSQQTLIATNGIIIGDVDCSGEENPVDSLKVLRFDAGLSVGQEEGCPEIGSEITIAAG